MKPRAHLHDGAPGCHFRRGFTLLEMCIVLFIIALLAGAMIPAVQSARIEKAVRDDAHQLSLMVKTAMLRSSEEHRPYVIDLTATTMALHPVGDAPPAIDLSSSTNDDEASVTRSVPDDAPLIHQLDSPNQLLMPDPKKIHAWIAIPPATSWLFQPGELCPAPHVRLMRGEAWLELSFNALTGNVEDETAYFP